MTFLNLFKLTIMKKIFAILTLLLAFSFSANAQETKLSIEDAATADFVALNKVVPIAKTAERNVTEVFYYKHKILTQPSLTAEQKQEIASDVENRLSKVLSEAQLKKLKSDQELYKKLIN